MDRTRICTTLAVALAVAASGVYAAPVVASSTDICDLQRLLTGVVEGSATAGVGSDATVLDWQRMLDAASNGAPSEPDDSLDASWNAQTARPHQGIQLQVAALTPCFTSLKPARIATAASTGIDSRLQVSAKDRYKLGLTPHAPPLL